MFAVGALMMNSYAMMANNMAFRGMMANNARVGMLNGMTGQDYSPAQLAAISNMDTQLEIEALTCGLQYKYAKAMLEQLKKLQDDDIKRSFSIFA